MCLFPSDRANLRNGGGGAGGEPLDERSGEAKIKECMGWGKRGDRGDRGSPGKSGEVTFCWILHV